MDHYWFNKIEPLQERKCDELGEKLRRARLNLIPIIDEIFHRTVLESDRTSILQCSLSRDQFAHIVLASKILNQVEYEMCETPKNFFLPNTNVIVQNVNVEHFDKIRKNETIVIDEQSMSELLNLYERMGAVLKRIVANYQISIEPSTPYREPASPMPNKYEPEFNQLDRSGIASVEKLDDSTPRQGSPSTADETDAQYTDEHTRAVVDTEPESKSTLSFIGKSSSGELLKSREESVNEPEQHDEKPTEPDDHELEEVRNLPILPPPRDTSQDREETKNPSIFIRIKCYSDTGDGSDTETDDLIPTETCTKCENKCPPHVHVQLDGKPVTLKYDKEHLTDDGTYCINTGSEDPNSEIKIVIKQCPACCSTGIDSSTNVPATSGESHESVTLHGKPKDGENLFSDNEDLSDLSKFMICSDSEPCPCDEKCKGSAAQLDVVLDVDDVGESRVNVNNQRRICAAKTSAELMAKGIKCSCTRYSQTTPPRENSPQPHRKPLSELSDSDYVETPADTSRHSIPTQPTPVKSIKEKSVLAITRNRICSSMEFDVSTVYSKLRDEGIRHPNPNIVVELKRLGVDQLLRACRPAKCCRKAILNERQKVGLPYAASLRSLPLTGNDVEVIQQSINMSVKKIKKTTNISQEYRNKMSYYVGLGRDEIRPNINFPWVVPVYSIKLNCIPKLPPRVKREEFVKKEEGTSKCKWYILRKPPDIDKQSALKVKSVNKQCKPRKVYILRKIRRPKKIVLHALHSKVIAYRYGNRGRTVRFRDEILRNSNNRVRVSSTTYVQDDISDSEAKFRRKIYRKVHFETKKSDSNTNKLSKFGIETMKICDINQNGLIDKKFNYVKSNNLPNKVRTQNYPIDLQQVKFFFKRKEEEAKLKDARPTASGSDFDKKKSYDPLYKFNYNLCTCSYPVKRLSRHNLYENRDNNAQEQEQRLNNYFRKLRQLYPKPPIPARSEVKPLKGYNSDSLLDTSLNQFTRINIRSKDGPSQEVYCATSAATLIVQRRKSLKRTTNAMILPKLPRINVNSKKNVYTKKKRLEYFIKLVGDNLSWRHDLPLRPQNYETMFFNLKPEERGSSGSKQPRKSRDDHRVRLERKKTFVKPSDQSVNAQLPSVKNPNETSIETHNSAPAKLVYVKSTRARTHDDVNSASVDHARVKQKRLIQTKTKTVIPKKEEKIVKHKKIVAQPSSSNRTVQSTQTTDYYNKRIQCALKPKKTSKNKSRLAEVPELNEHIVTPLLADLDLDLKTESTKRLKMKEVETLLAPNKDFERRKRKQKVTLNVLEQDQKLSKNSKADRKEKKATPSTKAAHPDSYAQTIQKHSNLMMQLTSPSMLWLDTKIQSKKTQSVYQLTDTENQGSPESSWAPLVTSATSLPTVKETLAPVKVKTVEAAPPTPQPGPSSEAGTSCCKRKCSKCSKSYRIEIKRNDDKSSKKPDGVRCEKKVCELYKNKNMGQGSGSKCKRDKKAIKLTAKESIHIVIKKSQVSILNKNRNKKRENKKE